MDGGDSSDEPKPESDPGDKIKNAEKVENQPFDEAVEINDSEDVDSDDDEEEGFGNQQNQKS